MATTFGVLRAILIIVRPKTLEYDSRPGAVRFAVLTSNGDAPWK